MLLPHMENSDAKVTQKNDIRYYIQIDNSQSSMHKIVPFGNSGYLNWRVIFITYLQHYANTAWLLGLADVNCNSSDRIAGIRSANTLCIHIQCEYKTTS